MLLILSDLPKSAFPAGYFPRDSLFFYAPAEAQGCCGCFRCWFEEPGRCVKKDGLSAFSSYMLSCERLLILSKNVYGSYSPAVKRVLERSISFVRPGFYVRYGEMHHKRRRKTPLFLDTVFYGEAGAFDRRAAGALARANAVNLGAVTGAPRFVSLPAPGVLPRKEKQG